MNHFDIDTGTVIRVLTDEIKRLEWQVEAERNRVEKMEQQLHDANAKLDAARKKIDELDNF